MARHKDATWNLSEPVKSWEEINCALMMDIRDELKRLNTLLHCSNFVGIPSTLTAINGKLRKPRRRKRT